MGKTYTVKQVAQALDFSTNTVYKYLDEGKIKATRLGKEGRFRIPEAEVIRLLQLKGEYPQIAPHLETQQVDRENGRRQVFGQPQQTAEVVLEDLKQDYNLKLGLLNKVSDPDLFDWFLSLTAIFLGIAYFLFPLSHQLISFEPYRLWLIIFKVCLIILGVALMAVDVFVPAKKLHHHLPIRLPLTACFAAIAAIFYLAGEEWTASYFIALSLFTVLSAFWQKGSFIKFVAFVLFLVVVSGWIYSFDPQAYIFADIRNFVHANPVLFRTLLIAGSTIFSAIMIFTYYFKVWPLMLLFSWLLSALFFVLSISFINDQAWNKAVVTLMIGSFSLILPFYKEFDSLSRFSRKDVLISFSWLVLILFIGMSVIFYTQATFKTFVLKELQQRAEGAAKLVDAYLEDGIKYTNTIAQNKSLLVIIPSQKSELEDFVKASYQTATTLKRLVIFDNLGNLLASYPPGDIEAATVNVSDREYFKQAKEQQRTVISELIESRIAKGGRTIVIAAPVIDATGAVLGIVAGGIDISQLEDKLSAIKFGSTGFFTLADNRKTVFIANNKDLIGQQPKFNLSLIKAVEGYSGQVEGYSEQGDLSLQAYTHIPKLSWGIVAQQPISEVFRGSSLISFTIFLITILSGVGVLLVTMYMRKRQL